MGMDREDVRDTVMDHLFVSKPVIPNNITINQNSSNFSDYQCRLFGIDDFFFIPSKGNEPNWFWRAMQYILIGNKWSKK